MFSAVTRTEGIDGLGAELLAETQEDVLSLIARAGEKLVRRAREKLGVGGGPSRPGDPPAKETGALQDSIGRTGPYTKPGTVELAWGVGVGDEALARVNDWKSRGVNVFEYADLHEHGGVASAPGYHPRRYPARSYIRSTEQELEAEVVADWERGL